MISAYTVGFNVIELAGTIRQQESFSSRILSAVLCTHALSCHMIRL